MTRWSIRVHTMCVTHALIYLVMAVGSTAVMAATDSASTATSLSESSKSSPAKFDFSYQLVGESLDQGEGGEKSVFGVELLGKYKQSFGRPLKVIVEAGARLESGREELVTADEDQFNQIFLKHAGLHYKPFSWARLRAGALNQSFIDMPLLVESRAFPALQQKFIYSGTSFKVGLTLQQAVPTSRSLSTKIVEDEDTPYFVSETLETKVKLGDRFSAGLKGTYFAFYQLPSVVAEQSGRHGNVVDEISVNQSYFRDPFQGYTVTLKGEYYRPGRNAVISYSYLENSYSETEDNTGFLAALDFPIAIGKSDVILRFEQFNLGATASPAYYNSYIYGHNNRQGYAAGLAMDLKSIGFQVAIRYVDSEVIESNANQFDEKLVMISAGVLDDLF